MELGFDFGDSGLPATGWQIDWVSVTVSVRRGLDWRGTWMANQQLTAALAAPAPRLQRKGRPMLIDLLRHQQGHLDITALVGRDLYHDVMALVQPRPTVFRTQPDLRGRVMDLQSEARTLDSALRDNYNPGVEFDGLYGEETRHGKDRKQQALRDAMLRLAWKGRPLREVLKVVKKV